MIRSLTLLLFLATVHASPRVEMYMGWNWDAKGQALFSKAEGKAWNEIGTLSKLARKLDERGIEIGSWELQKHRPELLRWSGVHSWSDLVTWAMPKKAEINETIWLFWSLGPHLKDLDLKRVPKENKILMIFEPPSVQKQGYDPKVWDQFSKVLTWDDDLVDGEKFIKYYYPVLRPQIAEIVPFEEKKLCCLFGTRRSSKHPDELYSKREQTIRFYEDKSDEFDLYGMFWEKRNYKNSRGRVQDKLPILKGYKFNICYENMTNIRGYVTEKIFDCFQAGVVPIYWGATNIEEYVPKACFIDRRDFDSESEVYRYIKGMDKEKYQAYLDAAAKFLQSPEAQLFSDENFVEIVSSHLFL